jgi:hypothetical protein
MNGGERRFRLEVGHAGLHSDLSGDGEGRKKIAVSQNLGNRDYKANNSKKKE